MSTIRKQSIISSGIVYFGFALGALNIYLFARGFEPAHFGLTTLFVFHRQYHVRHFANLGMAGHISINFIPIIRTTSGRKKMI